MQLDITKDEVHKVIKEEQPVKKKENIKLLNELQILLR